MLSKLARAALALPFFLAACDGNSSETGAAAGSGGVQAASARQTDMVLGDPDAPVTIIEYASVTCPACAAFHEEVLPAIKEKYIDTGKARLVFREFPTSPQGLSYVGSVLARCAADRGGSDAYFAVISALMRTQRTWIGENSRTELQKIAAQAGMDEAAFETCVQRQELVDLINENVEEGQSAFGIDSTPSFVVDGKRLTGVRTMADFETRLAEAIEAASPAGD